MKTKMIIFLLICLGLNINCNTITKPVSCLQMDIMLLGDFSGSVMGHEPFIAGAFDSFVNKFEVSNIGIEMGLVTFNSNVELVCPLTDDQDLLQSGLDQLSKKKSGGTTDMLGALYVALGQLEGKGRPGYRKMIILISDGEPDSQELTLEVAEEIKSKGVGICGIFVSTNGGNSKYLKSISSEFCYFKSNYENLITTLQKMDICL